MRASMWSGAVGSIAAMCAPWLFWATGRALGEEPQRSLSTADIPVVASKRLHIEARGAARGGPIDRAELWFTVDDGQTWQRWAVGQRAQGGALNRVSGGPSRPETIEFEADAEGVYGFIIVLYNAAGASSAMPTAGVAPQRRVRVDISAPSVRVLAVKPDDRFDLNREVVIRWSVEDQALTDRPVALHYRSELTRAFRPIEEYLAASGSHRWVVPEEVFGRIEIKVSATDLAGHTGKSIFDGLHLEQASGGQSPNAKTTAPDDWLTGTAAHGEPNAGDVRVGQPTQDAARKRYDVGTWHRLRGDTDQAMARFREAIKLDPTFLPPRHDLAGLLLLEGHTDEAEEQIRRILSIEPQHRPALKTMALVESRRRNYRSASEILQKLILLEPDDAEAWLYFGDVAMFMGDRPTARGSWAKIDGLPGATEEVKGRARTRLTLYPSDTLAAHDAGEP